MRSSLRSRLGPVVALVATLVLALVVGDRLVGNLDTPAIGRASRSVAGPTVAADLSEPRTPSSVGFTGPARPSDVDPDPVGSRRVWFAQGRWWGVFVDQATQSHRIWGLSGPDGPWVDTGVVVDDRSFAEPTVVWTGSRLVVAASGARDYRSHALRVSRFQWIADPGRWELEPDFPVQVTDAGGPGTQLAVTPDGRVWLARLDGEQILMARSDPTNLTYTGFAPLAGGLAGTDVGGFSLLADGARLRLTWRSASTDAITLATGDGTAWTSATHRVYGLGGVGRLEAVPAGPARPGALVVLGPSTLAARGSNDQDPAVIVVVVDGTQVDVSVVAVGADRLSSSQLAVDQDAGEVHVVSAAAPPDAVPGQPVVPWAVTDKVARVADPRFDVGQGPIVLRDPRGPFATPLVPTSVSDATGLLVVASGPDQPTWRSAQRGGPTPGARPAPRSGPRTLVQDTFDRRALGIGAPAAWYASRGKALSAEVVTSGSAGGRALAFTNPGGGEPATACRAVPTASGGTITVRADVRSEGAGTADARLLAVKGKGGTWVSVRLTRKGEIGFMGPNGRITQGLVADGTPLRVTVRLDLTARVADIRIERAGGGVVVDVKKQALLVKPEGGPREVCFTPAPNNPAARLVLSDLLVSTG